MVIRASVSFSGISARAVLEELEELAAARLVLPRKQWSQVGASINLVLWLVYIIHASIKYFYKPFQDSEWLIIG